MTTICLDFPVKLLGLLVGVTAALAPLSCWSQVGLGLQIGIGPYGGVYLGGGPVPFGPPPMALYRGLRPGVYPGSYYAARPAYGMVLPFPPPPAVVFRSSPWTTPSTGHSPLPNYYSYTPNSPSAYDRYGRIDTPELFGAAGSQGASAISPNSADLRPGMILPDGARVLSVGPLGGPIADQGAVPGANPPPESLPVPSAGETAVQRAAF